MGVPTIIETTAEQEFIARAAAFMADAIRRAIANRGHALLGLCGGTTVGDIFREVGVAAEIDWSKVVLFLTDDRYVPADDPRSNQFLLRSTLLRAAPIPASHLLFPDTSLSLKKCVAEYDHVLGKKLTRSVPDLVVLGMGRDGHIASLFPPLTDAARGPGHAIHTTTDQFEVGERISVTLPVLQRARMTLLLLKGSEKHTVWSQMLSAAADPVRWPAHAVMEKTDTTVIARW